MRWGLFTLFVLTACRAPMVTAPPPDAGLPEDAGSSACLSFFPARLDFGEIDFNSTAVIKLRVTNLSAAGDRLEVSSPDLPFAADLAETFLPNGKSVLFSVLFRPTDSLLHFSELELNAGCGSARVPISGLGRGVFNFSPEFLDFDALDPGEQRTLELTLTNTRRTPVTISGLTLFLAEGSDAGTFTLEGPTSLEVPAVGVRVVRVTATPPAFGFFDAFLHGSGPMGSIDVPMSVAGGAPVALLEPAVIDAPIMAFSPRSQVPPFIERVVTVRNVGHDAGAGTLRVVDPEFTVERADGGLATTGEVVVQLLSEFLTGIPPGAESVLLLRVTPPSLGPHRYRVKVFTNDPRQPEQVITIGGVATVLPACELQRPIQEIFTADPDAGSNGLISFANVGTTLCVLDDVRLALFTNPAFEVISGGTTQVSLMPGQVHEVRVHGPDAGFSRSSALSYQVLGQGGFVQEINLFVP